MALTMRGNVPQRQMLRSNAAAMLPSVGVGVAFTRLAAAITIPGVQ